MAHITSIDVKNLDDPKGCASGIFVSIKYIITSNIEKNMFVDIEMLIFDIKTIKNYVI